MFDLTRCTSSSPAREIVENWIKVLSNHLKSTVNYSERLHKILVNRANFVRLKFKKLKHGRQQSVFLGKQWKLQLLPSELSVVTVTEENKELKRQVSTTMKRVIELNSQVAMLSDELKKRSAPEGEDKRFNHKQRRDVDRETLYSERHQRLLKSRRTRACEVSLAWLQNEGFTPTKLDVVQNRTGVTETVRFSHLECQGLLESPDQPTQDEVHTINMMLYVKDRYCVSGDAYHELAQACKHMPRHYKIKARIMELNKLWNIRQTPNGIVGVQQSLEERLRARISILLKSPDVNVDHIIRVKLTGDGTWVGKGLHLINFGFTVLEEGSLAYSCDGNHPLAIFSSNEDYDGLYNALADIREDVETLKAIEVDGVTYQIVYYLGGDWKFLACITGIDSASSNYSCIWCKCSAEERWNMDKQWSICSESSGARTIEENIRLSKLPKSKKKYNVSHEPLFKSIPLTHVVIDNLHLFLRVSDVLIDRLIIEMKRHDAIDKIKKLTSFDPVKHHHLHAFEEFVTSLNIPNFRFFVGQNSKMLKHRSLTGPEKLKVFRNIQIAQMLPKLNEEEVLRIQFLWTKLLDINQHLSQKPSEIATEDIVQYKIQCKEWVVKFVSIYHSSAVTPYIHAMAQHAGDFIQLHGSLLAFTQQGLEKYNDITTKYYFRSTHHKGEQALRQLMEKQNRIDELRESQAKRPKHHDIKCYNCSDEGHNKLTCSKPCKVCGAEQFKGHLVTVNGRYVPVCEQENA